METINVEAFQKAWFTFEEINDIQEWLDNVKEWLTFSHEEVKQEARKKIFSHSKAYV